MNLIQQAVNTAASATSVVVTLPSAPTNGNALILSFGGGNAAATVASVSGGGVTWVKAKGSNAQRAAEIWYGLNAQSGGTAITVTYNATTSANANVSEWAGFPLSGDPVNASGSTSAVTTNPMTSASITPTTQNALIIANFRHNDFYSSGPNNSFTRMTNTTALETVYRIVSAIGSYSTTVTPAGAPTYESEIVAFNQAWKLYAEQGLVLTA